MAKPETIYIAISRKDGGLSVMQFVTKSFVGDELHFVREPTDKNINAEIIKSQISASSWRIMNDDELAAYLTADRTFRNAWKYERGIVVDMPKAREIHKDRLRAERGPRLAALDVEFMRAVEVGDEVKKTEISAKKQKLRDVTAKPEIEAAVTPEDLKAINLP